MTVYRNYRAFEDNPIVHGAWLVLTTSDRAAKIRDGSALHELASWAATPTMSISEQNPTGFTVRLAIANIGETDSLACRVVFIVWAENARVGIYKPPQTFTVPAAVDPGSVTPEVFEVPMLFSQITDADDNPVISELTDISHVFCLAYDPLRDPPDEHQRLFYREANRGQRLINVNPLRASKGIACCKPNDQTFDVDANRMTCLQGSFVEMALVYSNAGQDAGFGSGRNSSEVTWIGSLHGTTLNVLLPNKGWLKRGDNILTLFSNLGTRYSDSSSFCQMSQPGHAREILVKWEDGGGGTYDDYHLRLFEF